MINIDFVRQNPDVVREAAKKKKIDPKRVDEFLAHDEAWRKLTKEIDDLRAGQNELSAKVSAEKDAAARTALIEKTKGMKERIKALEEELRASVPARDLALSRLPNIPDERVPVGPDESGNVVVREVGAKPSFAFPIRDYMAIGELTDSVDTVRAGKVSGSRFGYLKNKAALLELALIQYAFETLVKEGFTPVIPPVMIKPEPYMGMGRLSEADKEERYHLEKDDLYLVGSAEHTIGPMHMDETFEEGALPRRYVAFSSCFRREAGSYGKDTKGIIRVHQFDKVEMFLFTRPEDSYTEHERLLAMQEKLMGGLGLPYRVVSICTGDMGFIDAKQYDVETWIPGENRYRETNSCSNTTDFQSRGLNIRYRRSSDGKLDYVHTLNATAIAIGRTIVAIIENYQTAEGDFEFPEVLKKYVIHGT
jgi:seryl-tRNA synthetase